MQTAAPANQVPANLRGEALVQLLRRVSSPGLTVVLEDLHWAHPDTLAASSRPSAARARADDVHDLALAMPGVALSHGPSGNPVYQVDRKAGAFPKGPAGPKNDRLSTLEVQ